jgi:hypothetical protein
MGSQFYVRKMEAVLTLRFRRETGAQVFEINSSKLPSKLQYSKVKVKLALCTLWRVRIVAYILYVGTKSGPEISFTTRPLYPRRRCPRYPHSPNFMQPWFSLLYSQQVALCSYPEPDQSSPCLPISLLKIHFNILFPSTPRSSKRSLSFRISESKLVYRSQ